MQTILLCGDKVMRGGGNHLHVTSPSQASISQNILGWVYANLGGSPRSAPTHVAAVTSEFFVLDVGCSHGYLQPEKGAVCPRLASPAISWEEVISLASSPLWLLMLWPLGYPEERGGYLTAVLLSTFCLVEFSNISEWQFSKVQAC